MAENDQTQEKTHEPRKIEVEKARTAIYTSKEMFVFATSGRFIGSALCSGFLLTIYLLHGDLYLSFRILRNCLKLNRTIRGRALD